MAIRGDLQHRLPPHEVSTEEWSASEEAVALVSKAQFSPEPQKETPLSSPRSPRPFTSDEKLPEGCFYESDEFGQFWSLNRSRVRIPYSSEGIRESKRRREEGESIEERTVSIASPILTGNTSSSKKEGEESTEDARIFFPPLEKSAHCIEPGKKEKKVGYWTLSENQIIFKWRSAVPPRSYEEIASLYLTNRTGSAIRQHWNTLTDLLGFPNYFESLDRNQRSIVKMYCDGDFSVIQLLDPTLQSRVQAHLRRAISNGKLSSKEREKPEESPVILWRRDEDRILVHAYKENKSLSELRRLIPGHAPQAVSQRIYYLIRTGRIIQRKPQWMPEETARVQQLVEEGKSYSEIAKIIGRSASAIGNHMKTKRVAARVAGSKRERERDTSVFIRKVDE